MLAISICVETFSFLGCTNAALESIAVFDFDRACQGALVSSVLFCQTPSKC